MEETIIVDLITKVFQTKLEIRFGQESKDKLKIIPNHTFKKVLKLLYLIIQIQWTDHIQKTKV